MARTVLTVTQATSRDTAYAVGAGVTPDATNGNIITGPIGPFHLGLMIHNGDSSAHTLYVRASGYAGSPTGGANASYSPNQYQPFAQASVGDLTVSLGIGAYVVIEALTTDRFAQAGDGSLWLDWSASTSVTCWAWQKPYLP